MPHNTVITPYSRTQLSFWATMVQIARNARESKDLIIQLFKRDFLMQYKKSYIGFFWIFLTPIIGIISWVFYNATGVLSPGDVGIPYPAYVLLSSTIFGLWSAFQSGAAGTLNAGAGFINQVNYPHEALLIKQQLIQIANFAIAFIINILVLLIYGVVPSWLIVFTPLLILPMIFLGSAIGLMIALIAVVAPDIQRLINFAIGLVMYVTPVIYSPQVDSPLLQTIIRYNPLTYLIGGVRDAIIYGHINHFGTFLILGGCTFVLFLISLRIFYIAEMKVIEKMI